MSVHITTGNRLDVVYDYAEDGSYKNIGLQQWDSKAWIPLPNLDGLISVLTTFRAEMLEREVRKSLRECEKGDR